MSVDLSNELKVQNAFIRRGLAAEQAGLLTYTVHEKVRHSFMAHFDETASTRFQGSSHCLCSPCRQGTLVEGR